MQTTRRTKIGLAAAAFLTGTMGWHGYASTNSITYQESAAMGGFGAAIVSEIDINAVDYTFDSSDKSQITSVIFTITPATLSGSGDAIAYAQHDGGTNWTNCGSVANGATSITCPINDGVENFGKDSNGDPVMFRLVVAE